MNILRSFTSGLAHPFWLGWRLGLILGVLGGSEELLRPRCYATQEAIAGQIRHIVASWKGRRNCLQTLRCQARVDAFYPKGYLSTLSQRHNIKELKSVSPQPPQDQWFRGGTCIWIFDFRESKRKIRKEFTWMAPMFYSNKIGEFIKEHTLFLLADDQCRMYRPSPWRPNVTVFGNNTICMITNHDLPLIWTFGGVNGEVSGALEFDLLESAERFTYRGHAEHKGRQCIVLTLPEQNSKTLVREFWVGLRPGYPIYCCRMRKGNTVYWEVEADYRRDESGIWIPTRWISISYDNGGSQSGVMSQRVFTIEKWETIFPLTADLFEQQYEPEQTVLDIPQQAQYYVDSDGNLIQTTDSGQRMHTSSWLVWRILLVMLTLVLLWHLGRRWLVRVIKN